MKALSNVKLVSNQVKYFFFNLKESQRLHSTSSALKKIQSICQKGQLNPAYFNSPFSLKLSSPTAWFRSYSCSPLCQISTSVYGKFTLGLQRTSPLLLKYVRCGAQMPKISVYDQQIRWKSKKIQDSKQNDSDSDSDNDDALAPDDFDAPAKFKVMKIHAPSMRTDAIISNSLDVSRSRLEEMFYGPGMLFNGVKMLKKSIKMEEGDYVDLVVDKTEEQLKVKRVKIIKVYSGKTNTEKLNIKVRVWKTPFLVNNPKNDRMS
ncbi:hypothetical protein EGW08_001480 [Elysia chlorotica]|uniref:Mitochondrial transcription rescue factor 1 C-terminal domain-containing protein n=1 Tax=Elysia chlorotica TaxID=188477 RepID=A0A3S1CEU4_ELYCH|nr:hypothetical protein EGW08_001480 [Elysia chlorotica]